MNIDTSFIVMFSVHWVFRNTLLMLKIRKKINIIAHFKIWNFFSFMWFWKLKLWFAVLSVFIFSNLLFLSLQNHKYNKSKQYEIIYKRLVLTVWNVKKTNSFLLWLQNQLSAEPWVGLFAILVSNYFLSIS